MQTLNLWAVRFVFLVFALAMLVCVACTGYGMLWYDHRYPIPILVGSFIIIAFALSNAYQDDIGKKRLIRRRRWGSFCVLTSMIVAVAAAIFIPFPPLREAAYIGSFVFYGVFGWISCVKNAGDFWGDPEWGALVARILPL